MMATTVQPRILSQSGVDELAHFRAVAGEAHQRPDGETELHAQRRPGSRRRLKTMRFFSMPSSSAQFGLADSVKSLNFITDPFS